MKPVLNYDDAPWQLRLYFRWRDFTDSPWRRLTYREYWPERSFEMGRFAPVGVQVERLDTSVSGVIRGNWRPWSKEALTGKVEGSIFDIRWQLQWSRQCWVRSEGGALYGYFLLARVDAKSDPYPGMDLWIEPPFALRMRKDAT